MKTAVNIFLVWDYQHPKNYQDGIDKTWSIQYNLMTYQC